jgi:hypothetical protein
METTNQNELVYSSQALTESGSLALGALPLDLGMSQLSAIEKDTIILADGRLVRLTGTDEDIQLIAADRGMRVKQTLIHLYLSGLNLATARDYFVEAYGSHKEFWEKITEKTGFSKAKLENEIKISQGFTKQEIESLAEAGATQSIAIRLLKASPAVKEEVIVQAEQGRVITSAVASEIMEWNEEEEEEEEDDEDGEDREPITPTQNASNQTDNSAAKKQVENTYDISATVVSCEEVITEENYASSVKLLEKRLQGLLNAIEAGRNRSFAIRGQSIREEQAIVLATFYNIKLPSSRAEKDESHWIAEARELLPKGVAKEFRPLYIMALVDGYLGYIRNEPSKPAIYETFTKYLKEDSRKACHNLFDVGFTQAKLEAESIK